MSHVEKLGVGAGAKAGDPAQYFIEQREAADVKAIKAAFDVIKSVVDDRSLQEIAGDYSVELLVRSLEHRYGVNLRDGEVAVDLAAIRAGVADTQAEVPSGMLYNQFLNGIRATFESFKRDATNCNDNGYVSKQAVDVAVNLLMARMQEAATRASRQHEGEHIIPML